MPNLGATQGEILTTSYDYGLQAESFPLASASPSGTILTAGGAVYGVAINVRKAFTVSALCANVTVAGATLTAGDCWGLLYSSAGVLLGQSADQTTPWQTAGFSKMTLAASATGSLVLTPGMYWGAVVATGSTLPTFSRSAMSSASVALASSFYNAGQGAASSRCGVLATGITTTPAAITPASITQATGIPYWFGLI